MTSFTSPVHLEYASVKSDVHLIFAQLLFCRLPNLRVIQDHCLSAVTDAIPVLAQTTDELLYDLVTANLVSQTNASNTQLFGCLFNLSFLEDRFTFQFLLKLLTILRHKTQMICTILFLDQQDVAVESSVCTHRCADISNHQLQQSFCTILRFFRDIY